MGTVLLDSNLHLLDKHLQAKTFNIVGNVANAFHGLEAALWHFSDPTEKQKSQFPDSTYRGLLKSISLYIS